MLLRMLCTPLALLWMVWLLFTCYVATHEAMCEYADNPTRTACDFRYYQYVVEP